MAYLDALIPPDIQDPAVAQQIYPWQRRTGPIAPPVFQSPADWPSPPAATAARPAMPQVAPAVNAAEAPGAGWSVRGSAPPVAPVAVGPSNVGAPTNAAAVPAAAPMQPVALGPGVATAQATPAQDALAKSSAPALHGWKNVLDIAGQALAPGVEEAIPGTPGNYRTAVLPTLKAKAEDERAYQTAQSEDALRAAQTQKAIFDANPKPEKPEDLNVLYAQAVLDAQKNGRDPATDPTVRQIQDAITSIQPERAPKAPEKFMGYSPDELKAEITNHPEKYPGGYMEGAAGFKNAQAAALNLDKEKKGATVNPEAGTWQLQEDAGGNPVEFNSKTGQVRAATGVEAKGTNKASYEFNAKELDKERTPLEATMGKISAATTNINIKSPQADALLAPQILSIAAGGTGSGLRMNEAEISRIVGGRTAWESLQAAANRWSTNPDHPAIPEAQRAQMVQILQAAAQKGALKGNILSWADNALVNSQGAQAQRQIVADARKVLNAVDQGMRVQRNKTTGEYRIAPGQ